MLKNVTACSYDSFFFPALPYPFSLLESAVEQIDLRSIHIFPQKTKALNVIKTVIVLSRARMQFLQLLKFPSQTKKDFIQNLPPEMISLIFTFLSIPDQICLALSCRYFLECLRASLPARQMQLLWLLPHERPSILCPSDKQKQRYQLLLRLENKRWKFCSHCWILHPHSSLWNRLTQVLCSHDYPLLGEQICLQTRLIQPVNEVSICPCLSISFNDKSDLIGTIEMARKTAHPGLKYFYNNALCHPSYNRQLINLFHICVFNDHPFFKVKIFNMFRVQESTQSLRVHSHYVFEDTRVSAPRIGELSRKEIRSWLEKFFAEAGSGFLSARGTDKRRTFMWECVYGASFALRQEPGSFEISLSRDIGDICTWPRRPWYCCLRC